VVYEPTAPEAGWFYAAAADPGKAILPTLESLAWSDEASVFMGPVHGAHGKGAP
jgi:hypothetical protein